MDKPLKRHRNAARTRQAILQAAFAEMYQHGFQAASVANILKSTHLTKGAFFHHFPTKRALGYAVVDEVIAEMVRGQWVVPLSQSDDPLGTILAEFERGIEGLLSMSVNLGCPLNNLAQEMSPLDPGFQQRTQHVFEMWVDCFAQAIGRGQARGQIKPEVQARETALMLVAQIEGLLSLSKYSQQGDVLRIGAQNLRAYFQTLRA